MTVKCTNGSTFVYLCAVRVGGRFYFPRVVQPAHILETPTLYLRYQFLIPPILLYAWKRRTAPTLSAFLHLYHVHFPTVYTSFSFYFILSFLTFPSVMFGIGMSFLWYDKDYISLADAFLPRLPIISPRVYHWYNNFYILPLPICILRSNSRTNFLSSYNLARRITFQGVQDVWRKNFSNLLCYCYISRKISLIF